MNPSELGLEIRYTLLTTFISITVRDEGTNTTMAFDIAMTTEQLGQLIQQLTTRSPHSSERIASCGS
jgi:hypothetical protein